DLPLFTTLRLATSPLFPYTTLFRSNIGDMGDIRGDVLTHLPIAAGCRQYQRPMFVAQRTGQAIDLVLGREGDRFIVGQIEEAPRSEEHTSELQSRENLVCRLLLEKK